jgi:hypothetical protein
MTATYEKIATTTLGSSATSTTFSSITGTYTDLVLVFQGTGVSGGTITYQFNGDTAANYSDTYMFSDGSASSGLHTSQSAIFGAGINTSQCMQIINIMNYSNTTTYKTTLLRGNANGVGAAVAFVGLWRNTAAITSITLNLSTSFASGSTFTLYGILKEA